ncbi:MAG: DUF4838 domain-containing protein [Lacunisphaera sp.]|nr:DUF4838 domain-containing protein [Lacunisphaera sp.]
MAPFIGVFLLLLVVSCRKAEPASEVTVFDQDHGCSISLPEDPSKEEQQAALLIQHTLVMTSGLRLEDFPVRSHERGSLVSGPDDQGKPVRTGSTLFIEGTNHRKTGEARLGEAVCWRVRADRVVISSYPADAIEAGAAWFLEQTVGARWFMPGELGEHVPALPALRLPPGEHAYAPSYISRNLWLAGATEEQDWWSRNRLRVWFRHGHAMSDLFRPEDLKRNPAFASMVSGTKLIPATANEPNWQPNIAAESAAEHAATVLRSRREFSSAIGMNDSIRFDQSTKTMELIGEPRWFRLKPDYSKLVFGFVNEVAKRVPGRYLGAYAYDWTEDTPGFPIERNVVPYLTADRSEWFDPAFAEEDRALIRRWVAAGPEVVGLYEYFEGAPYIVPRPTLYAVKQSIPFAYEAGVRAYFAEVNPNWGLDGPKAWLAAQLLWDATAKPEELLNIYYRDFWQEAAAPMREFFAACDGQWLNQPKPSYWLKYFKDEHQHLLFPLEVRQRLQGLLTAAQAAARSDLTRRRVEFFAQAFAVTDAFCAWQEAKERLSRAAFLPGRDQAGLHDAWRQLTDRERQLQQIHAQTKERMPLAVKAAILGEYERNDPRRRTAWRMKDATGGDALSRDLGGPAALRLSGRELLADTTLSQLRIKPPTGSTDLEWVVAGPWRGHGEPYETRRIRVEKPETVPLLAAANPVSVPAVAGQRDLKPEISETNSDRRTQNSMLSVTPQVSGFSSQVSASIVMRGCKQETFSQVTVAEPGKYYVARVKVRAKVSPGNSTFLILNFQDAAGQTMGLGVVDRLPVGEWGLRTEDGGQMTDQGVELVVWAKAPEKAKWVGLGVRALSQAAAEDYAAFEGFSLQAVEP